MVPDQRSQRQVDFNAQVASEISASVEHEPFARTRGLLHFAVLHSRRTKSYSRSEESDRFGSCVARTLDAHVEPFDWFYVVSSLPTSSRLPVVRNGVLDPSHLVDFGQLGWPELAARSQIDQLEPASHSADV